MSTETTDAPATLGARLLDPACYPHPVEAIRLVETHVSWVLLTGPFAYKVKKPVRLPFLDFSDPRDRLRFCEEELRVNRRLAPELYLEVVPIAGDAGAPRVGGRGTPFEHAVKMVQFDERGRLDRVLGRGELAPGTVSGAGRMVATFHARAEVAAPGTPFATLDQVRREALDNLDALDAGPHPDPTALEALRGWTDDTCERLAGTFEARRASGRVRECHGDLHLANLTLRDGEVVAFDALEFDERLRWIDVASEIAFTMMDLAHRGRADLAHRFLDGWLEVSGDHEALEVLRHYLVYRALVRAKIAAIEAAGGSATALEDLASLTALARGFALEAPAPLLVATHGLSGSGKSHLAGRLLGPWLPSGCARTSSAPGSFPGPRAATTRARASGPTRGSPSARRSPSAPAGR